MFKRRNSSTNLTSSPSSASLANGGSSSMAGTPSESSLAPPPASSSHTHSTDNGKQRSRTASISSSINNSNDHTSSPNVKRKSSKILRSLGLSSKNSSTSSASSVPSAGTPTKPPPAASSSFADPNGSPAGSISKRKSLWKKKSTSTSISSRQLAELGSTPAGSPALSLGSTSVDVENGTPSPRAASPSFGTVTQPPTASSSSTFPEVPTTSSPQSTSPISPAGPAFPSQSEPHLPSDLAAAAKSPRPRTASTAGESLWSYESDTSSISDSGFVTPDEGLSEVGEEDEDEAAAHDRDATLTRRTTGMAISRSENKSALLEQEEEDPTVGDRIRQIKTAPIPAVVNPNPSVKQEDILSEDLKTCHGVTALFLNSHIAEAEKIIREGDEHRERLYYQVGDGILSTLKGMMTFEPADLKHAIKVTTYVTELAVSHRRHSTSLTSRLSGFVKGGGGGLAFIKGMTRVQLHAELVYAETLMMKSVLGIVAGGDWMALVKEALNLRAGDAIYRSLNAFLEHSDAAASGGFDASIDMDLRSGIELGTGLSALMLSLLPGKVTKIAEMFGYHSSREYALKKLAQAGGWSPDEKEPGVSIAEEGLRRPVSDMVLMLYHLIIPSLVPVGGVDVPFAEKVVEWNLARYPNGVFTLFFQSRLHVLQCQPHKSNVVLEQAIKAQSDYIQLQLIARWDKGLNDLTLCQFDLAAAAFELLYKGSNWSKATYLYAYAAALEEFGDVTDRKKIAEAMAKVPKSIKKVAGKSLPIEKAVARKARKHALQGGRLLLPGLEISYIFQALSHSPAYIISSRTLPRIKKAIDELKAQTPEEYGKGNEYWDDWALAHFLKGFALGTYALPAPITVVSPDDPQEPLKGDERRALSLVAIDALQEVLTNGPKIVLDHWLIHYAHYEIGSIYQRREEWGEAVKHYEAAMSSRPPELDPHHKITGKYSLESGLRLKCGPALDAVREKLRPAAH